MKERTIRVLLEMQGTDGVTYAFGPVVEDATESKTVYELPSPVEISEPWTLPFDLEPRTRKLVIEGRMVLGGDLRDPVQYPLLWLTLGDTSDWTRVTAPLYVFVGRDESPDTDAFRLRVRENGEWKQASSVLRGRSLTQGGVVSFRATVLPGSAVWQVGTDEVTAHGVDKPFGPGMVLQVGHADRQPDETGDEELPAGTMLEALRIWTE